MHKIMFYSFKGGTGRTTGTANVGASLAQMGKNVMCIDLDIEAPGLHVVFGVSPREKTIKDYLKFSGKEFSYPEVLINLKEEKNWEISGNLYLLPASIGVETATDYSGTRIKDLLKDLFIKISQDKDLKIDYLLIDSANGYGDMAAYSMALSEHLLLFFKWSRQHLLGTVQISQFFKILIEKREKIADMELTDFSLVASSVPEDPENRLGTIRQSLEENVGKKVISMIPEDIDLKWEEKVLIFNEDKEKINEQYENVARAILDKFEEGKVG